MAAFAASAYEDYSVAKGQTETFALDGTTNFNSVTVGGALTLTGDGWIKTPSIKLDGGTLAIDGAKASIGSGNAVNATPTSFVVTNGEDGVYGKVTVVNGTSTGPVKESERFNFGAKFFDIATNAADVTGADGFIDVLSVGGGGVSIRQFRNYSSLTARVSVARNAWFAKGSGYAYGEGVFTKGAGEIALQEGSQLTFELGNQMGTFNAEGVPARITGTGDVIFRHNFNTSNNAYPMAFRKGAFLNHSGNLSFSGSWGKGVFAFQSDGALGPNVKKISPTGGDAVTLSVSNLVTLAVPNVDFVRKSYDDRLVGDGTILIDASAAARTFRANIPIDYKLTYLSTAHTFKNSLAVEKTGGNEAVVSSTTNFISLGVLEGPLRITSDCTISNLYGAAGAVLIADGCRVRVTGEAKLRGLALETANGGEFEWAGGGWSAAYEPGAIRGALHVADGSLVFSQYGFPQKYWRWKFTKVNNGPKPLHLGRFWVFDAEGEHAAVGLGYKAPDAALTAGTCRWAFDPATNVAIASSTVYWQGVHYLDASFRTSLTSGMNNFANLSSPVIDPDNPASHLAVEMRLKANAGPVTGYNIATALKNDYPVSWTVEASDDGETWTKVDEQTDFVHPNPVDYYVFFDGEFAYKDGVKTPPQLRGKPRERFHFTGYRRDGLAALVDPLSVQVDAGAELDLRAFTAGQPIGAITIDFAAGGGTIRGGVAAEGGTLTLKNAAASGSGLFAPLPLAVDGLGAAANLKSWTVVVDGAERKFGLALSDGALKLIPPGVRILIR